MNFFENQKAAQKRTKLLVLLFILAVAAIVFALYFFARVLIFKGTAVGMLQPSWFPTPFWDLKLFSYVAGTTIGIILLGSAWRIFQLSQNGGTKVAELMGGRPIMPNTTDTNEKRLLNVIEEMSIASGLIMPRVYVLDRERAINAFVSGNSPNSSVISVSRGALQLLNRDELQGVIAHEFSHIFNGDVKLNVRLMGLLNGILMIAFAGQTLMRFAQGSSRRRFSSNKKSDPVPHLLVIGFVLMGVGYIGVFFARLIQLAVSRQREFLADASAVQFTRLDTGITGALKKIGGLEYQSHLRDPFTSMTSHMLFADGIKHRFTDLLSTHPKLIERIKKIEPSFIGHYPKVEFPSDRLIPKQAAGLSDSEITAAVNKKSNLSNSVAPTVNNLQTSNLNNPALQQVQGLVNLVGVMSANSLELAKDFIEQQPEIIKSMLHEPIGARSLLYYLLFDPREHYRTIQLNLVRNFESKAILDSLNKLIWAKIPTPKCKLSLIELCFPALQQMSIQQYQNFIDLLQKVMKVDDHISIFEYALYFITCRVLNRSFGINDNKQSKIDLDRGLYPTVNMLLANLASLTHGSQSESFEAFKAGASAFGIPEDIIFSTHNFPSANLEDFDFSLGLIQNLAAKFREKLLKSCVAVVAYNHTITTDEYDLIRTIATSLDLPMPMMN